MVFSDLLNFQRTGMTSRAIHDRIEREMNSAQTLGGADWNRTSDPLLAKQVLSQLSYTPRLVTTEADGGSGWIRTNDPRLIKTVL